MYGKAQFEGDFIKAYGYLGLANSRVEDSRRPRSAKGGDWSRSSPGNGLGLSLVASVAQLHCARIEMQDNRPGLKIQLQFPTADGSAP
jgi:signal transduction histidine kinase